MDTEQTDEYCVECGSDRLIFDFRKPYYNFWICAECGHDFRTERFDGEDYEYED